MKLISSTSGGGCIKEEEEDEKFNNFRTHKRTNQLPDIENH